MITTCRTASPDASLANPSLTSSRPSRPDSKSRLPAIGSRIAVSAFGAYTYVHARTFGCFPLPDQYIVNDQDMEHLDE